MHGIDSSDVRRSCCSRIPTRPTGRRAAGNTQPSAPALACLDNEFLQVTNPRNLHGRRLCGQPMFNGGQTHRIKSCQFTQRKNLVEMVILSQPILCVGQQYPWSEEHEVIENVPALSDE